PIFALPNPHGSTGFGQQFVDEISRDWSGKVFEDLMAGLAYLEATQNADGGWPYQNPSDYGTDSDANSTALIIETLIGTHDLANIGILYQCFKCRQISFP
ncbi:MAG: prolyl oligopeptidase family serine peptidase, partial [Clostridiales bacterium]|nr:prolyl oligopeptidase family serine peptidase [Clostridiales bacterium]